MSANSTFIEALCQTLIGYGAPEATVRLLTREVRRHECAATTATLKSQFAKELHQKLDDFEMRRQADLAGSKAAA